MDAAGAANGPGLDPRVPHGHWKTAAFIAAFRHGGIAALFVLDGPINGEWFLAYVKEVLVPALSPGDIVRPGNSPPGSHNKSLKIKKAIEATGAGLRFLPRYPPGFNPKIPRRAREMFSKLKTLLRNAAGRSAEALGSRIGELPGRFPPDECENYFKAAGYGPT